MACAPASVPPGAAGARGSGEGGPARRWLWDGTGSAPGPVGREAGRRRPGALRARCGPAAGRPVPPGEWAVGPRGASHCFLCVGFKSGLLLSFGLVVRVRCPTLSAAWGWRGFASSREVSRAGVGKGAEGE